MQVCLTVPLEEFDQRKDQKFWQGLTELPARWDDMIDELNGKIASA